MHLSDNSRQLSLLLRASSELDIVGDVTATVDSPSELIAWAHILTDPVIRAWRTQSGNRFVDVSASSDREPVRGAVTAVLPCEDHREFWDELPPARDLGTGEEAPLTLKDLSAAWEAMPLTPET
ncbi:hypothetical protein [Georgenia sp. SYP-B2076]|uniref:hypothetical protein n=1 Tax=Georgenia sp. SYP-B2076 TaxID=2495881 RepID=UPI000F8F348C|nr:hypothetical protein [Georgenia sp. SYP-B2076]